jgi:hypothetical protein
MMCFKVFIINFLFVWEAIRRVWFDKSPTHHGDELFLSAYLTIQIYLLGGRKWCGLLFSAS